MSQYLVGRIPFILQKILMNEQFLISLFLKSIGNSKGVFIGVTFCLQHSPLSLLLKVAPLFENQLLLKGNPT